MNKTTAFILRRCKNGKRAGGGRKKAGNKERGTSFMGGRQRVKRKKGFASRFVSSRISRKKMNWRGRSIEARAAWKEGG